MFPFWCNGKSIFKLIERFWGFSGYLVKIISIIGRIGKQVPTRIDVGVSTEYRNQNRISVSGDHTMNAIRCTINRTFCRSSKTCGGGCMTVGSIVKTVRFCSSSIAVTYDHLLIKIKVLDFRKPCHEIKPKQMRCLVIPSFRIKFLLFKHCVFESFCLPFGTLDQLRGIIVALPGLLYF